MFYYLFVLLTRLIFRPATILPACWHYCDVFFVFFLICFIFLGLLGPGFGGSPLWPCPFSGIALSGCVVKPTLCVGLATLCTLACGPSCLGHWSWLSVDGQSSCGTLPSTGSSVSNVSALFCVVLRFCPPPHAFWHTIADYRAVV